VNPEIRLLARLCEHCRQRLQRKQFLATNSEDEALEQTDQGRTDRGQKGEAE
jgi:hypothetical protein